MAKRVLGIHIGDYRIICVEARVSGSSVVTEKIGVGPLPELSVVNGVVANPRGVLETLESITTQMEITTGDAIINIPPNLSVIKCIPYEEKYLDLTDDQIKWELSHHINESVEQYLVSAFSLSATTVLVGAKEEAVNIRVAIAEKLGLTVLSVDPDPVAVFNLFALWEGARPKKNYVVVNVEVPFSSVVMFSKGEFWYGGALFTPPELFGYEGGKKSWREFTEDLVAMLKMGVEAYTVFNPLFEPEEIYFVGRPLPDDVIQNVLVQLNLKSGKIDENLRKKARFKPKKGTINPREGVVALGLAAHGSVL